MLNPGARRGPQPLGKLKSRVEELKNPWRQSSPLVLGYNESARLATDALLEQGEEGYLQVLNEEKELPFLSSLDIDFICSSVNVNRKSEDIELPEKDSDGAHSAFGDHCPSDLTSGTYFPLMSDIETPVLELGWPEIPQSTSSMKTEVQVIFQRNRSNTIKDLIRSLINKANKVIAVVMDLFTDVEMLCDLIEASSKRKVPVYVLIDEKNLVYFIEMYEKLGFNKVHFTHLIIRTVTGDTYCTKSGKKFSGQFLEKFLMIDCEQVIAGSYSYNWLSSHVHSNMVTYFKGRIVEDFEREFRCLYADSQIPHYFSDLENGSNNSFVQNLSRNRWLATKSPQLPPPVPERSIPSDSNSSSGSQSSVQTSPFTKNQALTVINKDKYVSKPAIVERNKPGVDIFNDQRRQSDPNTGLNNFSSMQKSLLSQSTPVLNGKHVTQTSSHHKLRLGDIFENKPQQQENETSYRMKGDAPLNKALDCAVSEDKEDTSTDEKYGDKKSKRMTLGHSKLELITKYNKMHGNKVYSRFRP